MAAKKKATPKKATKKKATKKKATKKKAKPPMHQPVSHPELDDDARGDEAFEIFRVYDRDGSGSIDRTEFARLLEAEGIDLSEEELNIALEAVDANGSGRISWQEFKTWWAQR